MKFQQQPPALVDNQGQVAFGVFPQTVASINGREADYRTPMGKPASSFTRHFHYKQFQYFGIISDELLAGCAFAHTGYLGMAFFYLFEPQTGALHEYTWRSLLGKGCACRVLRNKEKAYFGKNVDIRLGYQQDDRGALSKSLSMKLDDLTLHAQMDEGPDYQPMSLCTRTGINGWVYANKVAGKAVTGSLQRQGKHTDLAAIDASGHHDFPPAICAVKPSGTGPACPPGLVIPGSG